MGAKDCCLMGLRKKRCGASCNEGFGIEVLEVLDDATAEMDKKKGHVASFLAMERYKQLGELLQGGAFCTQRRFPWYLLEDKSKQVLVFFSARWRAGGHTCFVRSLFNSVQVVRLACSIPIGWAYAFHQDKASSVKVPVANVTLFSSANMLDENMILEFQLDSITAMAAVFVLPGCSKISKSVAGGIQSYVVFPMLTSFWEATLST
ncbi:hypothetical protein Tco_0610930 [Tanacetum coccineum]